MTCDFQKRGILTSVDSEHVCEASLFFLKKYLGGA